MHHAETTNPGQDTPPRASTRTVKTIGIVLFVLLLAGGAVSIASRIHSEKVLAKETDQLAIPMVAIVQPKMEKPDQEIVLPASLQAYTESPIYARTNGYLLHWYKDIGSRVTKGALLADIDTPEVDQELMQARAVREQTQAQLQLAKISATRWQDLRKTDSVSQQETDQMVSGYRQAQANLAAADANVKRLEQLESFKHVYAPFAGVITKRNVDVGALINAGNGGSNHELFDIAEVGVLRAYVNVPQAYAPAIHRGMSAYLAMTEYPGKKFPGKVVRTADAIDPATRTLLTEIDVPNHDRALLPGAFVEVHFAARTDAGKMTLPENALIFRAHGLQAAIVGNDGKVSLQAITIGRDFGTSVEVLTGISPGDNVVVNPPDSLENGATVHVASGSQQ